MNDALPENNLITVDFTEDGKATITLIDSEQEVTKFPGSITAEKIWGEFHYYKSGPPSGPIVRVEINRYTGDYLKSTRYPPNTDFQMPDFKNFGTCKPAGKQKF